MDLSFTPEENRFRDGLRDFFLIERSDARACRLHPHLLGTPSIASRGRGVHSRSATGRSQAQHHDSETRHICARRTCGEKALTAATRNVVCGAHVSRVLCASPDGITCTDTGPYVASDRTRGSAWCGATSTSLTIA